MTLLFSIAFSAMFFGNVFFLTERWHLSILEAGSGSLLVRSPSSRSRSHRAGWPTEPATARSSSSGAWCSPWEGSGSFFVVMPLRAFSCGCRSLLMGTSIGMVLPSLSGAAVSQLDAASFGAASGVNQAVRQLGSVLGVAIVVLVLGGLGKTARFEHVFALVVVSGLLTAIGGMLLPPPPLARAA